MRQEIILATLAACVTQAFAQSGSIAGAVTGADNNAPLPSAGIVLVGRAGTGAPVFFQTTTAKDGSYVVPNVPAGNYTVCARYKAPITGGSRNDFWASRAFVAEEIAYLDSCDWSQTQPKTNVSAGQASASIRLQRGVNVSVLVDDPANLLDSTTDSGVTLQISVLDAAGNARAAMPMMLNTNGLRRFGATLPTGSNLTLDVQIRGATLVPSTGGAAYATAVRLPVQTANRSVLAAHFKVQK
jgi:hypothetical protein